MSIANLYSDAMLFHVQLTTAVCIVCRVPAGWTQYNTVVLRALFCHTAVTLYPSPPRQ